MKKRHYRTRRNRLIYIFSTVMVIVGLSIAVAPNGGFLLPLTGSAIIIFAVLFTKRGMRIGVEVGIDGVVVYGPFQTQHVAWDNVMGLGTHCWSINKVVDLKLVDGRTLNTNLIQGAPVVWDEGKSTDILSILQAELESRGAYTGGEERNLRKDRPGWDATKR